MIAGGGMAGSSLFRYFAEAGMSPVLINYEKGSSWRNIAGDDQLFLYPNYLILLDIILKYFKSLMNIKILISNQQFMSILLMTRKHINLWKLLRAGQMFMK